MCFCMLSLHRIRHEHATRCTYAQERRPSGRLAACTEAEQRTIQSLDAHIRQRLRAIVLRHCKRKRHIVQRLVSLGVQASAAWTEVYKDHRSLWVLSACFAVQRALGIRFFEERKLVSVEERWRKLRAQHDIASAQQLLPLR